MNIMNILKLYDYNIKKINITIDMIKRTNKITVIYENETNKPRLPTIEKSQFLLP